jgi:FAD/FMN-containing dehydrogenase
MTLGAHDDDKQHRALPDFAGRLVRQGDPDYAASVDQYATTSVKDDGSVMKPGAIIYCANVTDVQLAVNYAREQGIAVAVRTGGHQYCGMSSTTGGNIQVDLSSAFFDVDLGGLVDDDDPTVTLGVSFPLGQLMDKVLKPNKIFVPHGECATVHLGGHVHTGGYGMLCRSFGLLGDYVRAFQIVTADGAHRTVTRDSDPDLFYAVLGGSPGNFGVMTHVTLRVVKDVDSTGKENYPNSRGLMAMYPFRKEHMENLLRVFAELNAMEDLPGDLDLCVTCGSPFVAFMEGAFEILEGHDSMKAYRAEYSTDGDVLDFPAAIIVAAQWANLGGADQPFDPSWFEKLLAASPSYGRLFPGKDVFRIDLELLSKIPGLAAGKFYVDESVHTPLSVLSGKWIFLQNPREFNTPYMKRVYATKESQMLVDRDWAGSVMKRVALIEGPLVPEHGCHFVCQFEITGGKSSKTFQNRDNGTSYAWRDSTIGLTFDCFYDEYGVLGTVLHLLEETPKSWAHRWVTENDQTFVGEDGTFDTQDRRLLWGSYSRDGEHSNMGVVWPRYYDSADQYARMCDLKKRYDPTGVFTPNAFCVGVEPPAPPA